MMTQLERAKKGIITKEMKIAAAAESIDEEKLRQLVAEVSRGRKSRYPLQ
jgi:phosphomethylpyrimidine synthase